MRDLVKNEKVSLYTPHLINEIVGDKKVTELRTSKL